MISIKSIDVHIGHESSVGVHFAKRSRKIESNRQHAMVSGMFVLLTIGDASVGLVLVFAATRKEMALRLPWSPASSYVQEMSPQWNSVRCGLLRLVLVLAATRKEMALLHALSVL